MKDLPALLCAVLSVRSPGLLGRGLRSRDRLAENAPQLRADHALGNRRPKEPGHAAEAAQVLQWLEARSDEQLFSASVGNDPSLADVIKMVHPRPSTASRQALFGYLVGRQYDAEALPEIVRAYEKFKRNTNPARGRCRTCRSRCSLRWTLGKKEWTEIARQCPVADDAHEPEHVRATRRVRDAGHGQPDRRAAARPASWWLRPACCRTS